MQNPFFSVIMPVYNVEAHIAKAIQSVLNQTIENFELLIINDGSPDGSLAIAEKYAVSDSRIRIFNKQNGGLSDARNFGIEHAEGRYLYFVDSDDWITKDLLEKLYEKILLNPSDIFVFGYHLDVEDIHGITIQTQTIKYRDSQFLRSITKPPKLDTKLLNLLGYAWNKVYSKNFIDKHELRFDKGISLVEDMLFNSRAFQKVSSVIIIEECYYHYINREVTTLIKSYHKDSFKLILKKHQATKAFLKDWEYSRTKINRILAQNLVLGIQYCINNLLYYKNDLSASEKKKTINEILQHKETKKYIDFYQPTTKSDQLYKKLIKYRLTSVLMYIKSWKKAA